ncbi:MAG: tRNA (adenosine(37)-N6)-threonylcarbamoyltransferase complex dimerization subunit type 1 TsaB [Oscillospiraceae bacterium]|nr:tRNA (adenosine(37)-N6)-threonylcarbamoyltransferase complex dimerization subunit type 1 TsaB [Oscillospiraceae bacterium]
MLILAFESSAKPASAALVRDGKLLAQSLQVSALTHSRTLLPMAEDLLKNTGVSLGEVDAFAVAHGPGSFTGIRIGVSTVKGLCWGAEKPCVGVSTLEAMAWHGLAAGGLICPVMDARRAQVYNALFRIEEGRPVRLCPDRAIALEELAEELRALGESAFLVGDGASPAKEYFDAHAVACRLAPDGLVWQDAWGVAMAAQDKPLISGAELLPVYLRLSQAERERQARMEQEKG